MFLRRWGFLPGGVRHEDARRNGEGRCVHTESGNVGQAGSASGLAFLGLLLSGAQLLRKGWLPSYVCSWASVAFFSGITDLPLPFILRLSVSKN